MKLNNRSKVLAGLSMGAFALLPAISFAAEDAAAKPAGMCKQGTCDLAGVTKAEPRGDKADSRRANAEPRVYLGVVVQPLTPQLAAAFNLKDHSGALVAEVMPGSPAEKSGLKPGDVITSVAGKQIEEAADLRGIVASQEAGAAVDIEHYRDGKKVTAQATLGEPVKRQGTTAQAEPDVLDGIGVTDLTDEVRERLRLPAKIDGVIVTEVKRDSAADRAGLQQGDVIRRIGREDIKDANEAVAVSEDLKGEESVAVLLWRQGASRFVVISDKA